MCFEVQGQGQSQGQFRDPGNLYNDVTVNAQGSSNDVSSDAVANSNGELSGMMLCRLSTLFSVESGTLY